MDSINLANKTACELEIIDSKSEITLTSIYGGIAGLGDVMQNSKVELLEKDTISNIGGMLRVLGTIAGEAHEKQNEVRLHLR